MNHLVITMSDNNYFPNGKLFLKTRDRVNADFLLYTPTKNGLTWHNNKICRKHDIDVATIHQSLWDTRCQSMIFEYIYYNYPNYDYITVVDFDTFFINDWVDAVYKHNFAIGVTITEGFPQWNYLRSKANGGVMFYKDAIGHTSLLRLAKRCINNGGDPQLPEYDTIWKTLEDLNRPAHKRHYRTNKAWWCDQVLLSALYMARDRFHVKAFPCKKFNILDSKADCTIKPDIYIRHLKSANRPIKKGVISG